MKPIMRRLLFVRIGCLLSPSFPDSLPLGFGIVFIVCPFSKQASGSGQRCAKNQEKTSGPHGQDQMRMQESAFAFSRFSTISPYRIKNPER